MTPMITNNTPERLSPAAGSPVPTRYTLLDRYNADPTRRRTEREDKMLHQWHNLKRGDAMPERPPYVIVGFYRGHGGMYANYGPSINEVCGWAIISASQAKGNDQARTRARKESQ